jgi:hypothetical protein
MANNRTHPELHWMERETEHFILIYHQGLEEIAVRAATIAEQIYEPVTRGLETEMGGKTSIFLTEEDQIVNGFALPRRMFIWVNTNRFPAHFGGTDKWMRQVIAHEFQHVVWMEAAQDWTGIWSLFGTPLWFVEGVAEYQTEEWGANRSDLDLRTFFLRNRHRDLDPHDSGFSMVRYMADQYGDSVLVQAVKKRDGVRLAQFKRGFYEASGITLRDFEEEWRRAATAHTYALYSQKEPVDEVGAYLKPPAQRLQTLAYSNDGKWIGTLLRPPGQLAVLAVVSNDSIPKWHTIDHGRIHSKFSLSSNGSSIVYAKMHRARHGGIVWDLKVADVQRGTSRWITWGRRATHPDWSPTEDRIVYAGIDGPTTNLYTSDPDGVNVRQLTDHTFDVQVLSPRFSPDGSRLVFSRFERGRGVDLAVLDLASGRTRYVTENPSHDFRPLWSLDGTRIFFTSDRSRDEVPNLFTLPADGGEGDVECMSDVGEALFGVDVQPDSGDVVAIALATTDTVRLRRVPPDRRTQIVDPVIQERFVRWRDRVPPNPIPPIDYDQVPEMTQERTYRAYRRMRNLAWLLLPSPNLWGVWLAGLWLDTAHRNSIPLGLDVGSQDGTVKPRAFFGRWDTNNLPWRIPGFLRLTGGWNSRIGFQIYGGDLLVDRQSPVFLDWRFPMNWGEHFYANHDLELFGSFRSVEVEDPEEIDRAELERRNLPLPRIDYRENKLGASYRYTKTRPHPRRNDTRVRGHGFLARFEWASESLGSDVDYKRVSVDASKAFRIPLPLLGVFNSSYFARVRGQADWGEPAPQNFTGLRGDVPILPLRYRPTYFFDDILEFGESYFVRGFPRNVPGKQALMTTLEWRLHFTGTWPVSIFGIGLGGLTGVLFYDHGRVWDTGSADVARHTVGWEVRLPVRFFRRTLLVPSYGEGQTLAWERGDAPFLRDEYFRIAMVQPF